MSKNVQSPEHRLKERASQTSGGGKRAVAKAANQGFRALFREIRPWCRTLIDFRIEQGFVDVQKCPMP